MTAAKLNLNGSLALEQGARYLLPIRLRQNRCDVWTVQVTARGADGDTLTISLFDATNPNGTDLPQFADSVTHTVVTADTVDTIATALAAAINALVFTQIVNVDDDTCDTETVDLVSATASGDTVTIVGGRREDYLAIVASTTGTAALVATNTDTVLYSDITGDTFTSQVRSNEDATTVLVDWGPNISVTNGPLGYLQLLVSAAETATYDWCHAIWDFFWDRGGGDIRRVFFGSVEIVDRVTQ